MNKNCHVEENIQDENLEPDSSSSSNLIHDTSGNLFDNSDNEFDLTDEDFLELTRTKIDPEVGDPPAKLTNQEPQTVAQPSRIEKSKEVIVIDSGRFSI